MGDALRQVSEGGVGVVSVKDPPGLHAEQDRKDASEMTDSSARSMADREMELIANTIINTESATGGG